MAQTIEVTSYPWPDAKEISNFLIASFPRYKVKIPLLNPSGVMVSDGASMVLVNISSNRMRVAGGVNTANLGVALGVGIGVVLGFIGALIFLGIVYFSNQDKFGKMEKEVADAIMGKFPTKMNG
jgi:hypothetical protein